MLINQETIVFVVSLPGNTSIQTECGQSFNIPAHHKVGLQHFSKLLQREYNLVFVGAYHPRRTL